MTALQGTSTQQPDNRLGKRRQAVAAIQAALATLSAVKISLKVAAENVDNETDCGRLESVMADCVEPAVRDLNSILQGKQLHTAVDSRRRRFSSR